MSHSLRALENRKHRTKMKAKHNRIMRNCNMKGDRKRVADVNWLAGLSLYLKNLWAFKNIVKPEDVKK